MRDGIRECAGRLLVGSGSLLLLLVPQIAAAISVPLTLRDRAGVDRTDEAVTFGVPLPMGSVFSDQSLAIQGTDAQFRATGTWPDGSIRWVLCDFRATVPANGSVTYDLVDGSGDATGTELNVSQGGGKITVTTGPMRFTVKDGNFNLFDEVWIDENGDRTYDASERIVLPGTSPGYTLVDRNANYYETSADPNSTVEVESSGSMRVVLKASGHFVDPSNSQKHVKYTCRIYAYAGKSYVRVFFSELNDVPTGTYSGGAQPLCRWLEGEGPVGGSINSRFIEDMSLEIPLNLTGSKVYQIQGDAQNAPYSGTVSGSAYLYQDSSGSEWWASTPGTTFDGYKFYDNGVEVASGDQSEGWADLSDSRWGAAIGMRHFWENFPGGLEVEDTGVIRARLYPSDYSMPCEHRSGEQKTREMMINFHQGTGSQAGIAAAMGGLDHPLRADAPSQWVMDSYVMGPGVAYDDVNYYDYEMNNGDVATNGLLGARDDADFYGWQDFGEFWSDFEGGGAPPYTNKAAFNNEYDLSFGCFKHYARTSEARPDLADKWWDLAEASARHQADIDIYHVWEGPLQWLWGGQFIHTTHGRNGYDDPHRGNSPMPDHYMTQGMWNYYYMTGNEFVRDAAEELSENCRWRVMNGPGMPGASNSSQERNNGHGLQVLTDAYIHTWDPAFEQACEKLITEGHIDTKWYANGPNGDGSSYMRPWMVSLQMKSMGRFIEAYEMNHGVVHQEARESLMGFADVFVTHPYNPPGGGVPGNFPYEWRGDGSTFGPDPMVNMWSVRVSDGLVLAAKYSTDPVKTAEYLTVAREIFESGSLTPWCLSCAPYQYGQAKTHSGLATSGHYWMEHEQRSGPQDVSPPAQITDLAATAGSGTASVDLTWTAPGDDGTIGRATSYFVRYSTSQIVTQGDWQGAVAATGVPAPQPSGSPESMTVSGLNGGTTYYFAVRARDEAGNIGDISNSPSAMPSADNAAPVITSLDVIPTATAAFVTWTTNEPASSLVDYGPTSSYGSTAGVAAVGGTSHAVLLTGLTPGTTYHFRVRSADAQNNESESPDQTFTTGTQIDTTPPAAPVLRVARFENGSVLLGWMPNTEPDLAGYDVYRRPTGEDETAWAPINDVGLVTDSGFLDVKAASGERYDYAVRALDTSANESGLSNVMSVLVPGVAVGTDLWMAGNYPNPFNSFTTIGFVIPLDPAVVGGTQVATKARVSVFDITGRLVKTLASGDFTPGAYSAIWNGQDDQGLDVTSGIYFARLEAEGHSPLSQKLVYLRK